MFPIVYPLSVRARYAFVSDSIHSTSSCMSQCGPFAQANEISSASLVNGSLELLRFGTNTRVGAKLSFQYYYLRLVDDEKEMEHIQKRVSRFFDFYTHRVNSNVFIFIRIIVNIFSKFIVLYRSMVPLFKYSVFGLVS